MKKLGVDEAGRGAVIGPLVVAGVLLDETGEKKLRKVGVKDSKKLSPEKREELASIIKETALDYIVVVIEPWEIDSEREVKNLNVIEAEVMADIIKKLGPDVAYVDSPQVNTERFSLFLEKLSGRKVVAETDAERYTPVAAASILAKVRRDEEVRKIEAEVGVSLGTGYPHDLETNDFFSQKSESEFSEIREEIMDNCSEHRGRKEAEKIV